MKKHNFVKWENIFIKVIKRLCCCILVFPLKYRKKVITEEIGEGLKAICIEISERYEINFVEIGYEEDHVHFLIQSVPSNSVDKMIRIIKSITAKELFKRFPEIKQKLWGGNFWTSGYYANTVGQYANEEAIRKYVENQDKPKEMYKKIYSNQLTLF